MRLFPIESWANIFPPFVWLLQTEAAHHLEENCEFRNCSFRSDEGLAILYELADWTERELTACGK
jgi:hypothetical protein